MYQSLKPIENRQSRRNKKKNDIIVGKNTPYLNLTNGYLRNKTENKLLQEGLTYRKPHISKEHFNNFRNFVSELKNNQEGYNLIYEEDRRIWNHALTREVIFLTSDSKTYLSIGQTHNHNVKLEFIYSEKDANLKGTDLLNLLLNLCDKYNFHLTLSAVPIQSRGEFSNEWLQQVKKENISFLNPLTRRVSNKTYDSINGYVNNTERKTLESLYGLFDYYKKFGFIAIPTMLNHHFLSTGFLNYLTSISMVRPHPKMNLKKTFPWYDDTCLSAVGSIKKTFTFQQSVEFVNWCYENRRIELFTRNLDVYKLIMLMDTNYVIESEKDNPTDFVKTLIKRRTKKESSSYSSMIQQIIRGIIEKGGISKSVRELMKDIDLTTDFMGVPDLIDDKYKYKGNFDEIMSGVV